ncbi:putative neuraminidase [Algoriphagus ratkowskyi]|uniref:Exo-alpha-sialidase n=1 Tax=Algoriphagus ratkowskyi TaxID=57028 RepID=A0A2W7R2C7_9BACT|nr:exo-alpha-sialidase [Algoriphagus ratkowskyi]PZX54694.1 putative neuraminidase [Algoriphagus ratkowskyi]TXD77005.1 exo-alpha-sialidase [Algoriphagus ratkowskyi]
MLRFLLSFLFAVALLPPILLAQENKALTILDESIFPIQEQHAHGSSIVYLPNGDLLTAWFQGSGEREADDVRIMGARKKQGQDHWTKPFLMADTPGIPDCNPVLFLNQNNELFLVWIAVMANSWEQSILRVKRSTDFTKESAPKWTWQDNILLKPGEEFAEEVERKFSELADSGLGWAEYAPRYKDMIIDASHDSKKRSIGWMTRIKPLIIDQKIILPLYSDGYNFSMMAISDDQGETWMPSLPLVGKGPIQPALVQKANGDIIAMLRDSGDAPPKIHKSLSTDQGQSWSLSKKTEFPNTASVEILELEDGRWWMVGNDLYDGRYQLALWISDDEGSTWAKPVYLEFQSDNKSRFSYPAMIQDSKGFVHITYSKHLSEGKTIQYRLLDPRQIH